MTKIRVVLYQEDGRWVAQGLEYDIRAQAKNLKELPERFNVVVEAEKCESSERNDEAFKGIGRAPQRFFEMWEECDGSYKPSGTPEEGPFEMALCA